MRADITRKSCPSCTSMAVCLASPSPLTIAYRVQRLFDAHAAYGAGCVERSQHNASAPKQELGRLHEAAAVIGPPRAERFRLFPRNAVSDGELRAGLSLHLLGVFQRVGAYRDDAASERFQFLALLFPLGQLPNAVRSPVGAVEQQREIARWHLLWQRQSVAADEFQ